jgi:hypothetical protein
MEPMSTMAIIGVAISAIESAFDVYKKATPDWEQKEAKKIINKWEYLKDLYEIEKKKPRWTEGADNSNARSEDRLLNIRDKLLSYGKEACNRLRSL